MQPKRDFYTNCLTVLVAVVLLLGLGACTTAVRFSLGAEHPVAQMLSDATVVGALLAAMTILTSENKR